MAPFRVRAGGLAALALVAGALATAAPAGAATVRLDSGTTTLRLDPATARSLDALGVSVSALRPARASGGGIAFPVSGGRIDPATAAGRIDHRGGLQLRSDRARVPLRAPRLSIGDRRSTLSVRIGRDRLHAFTLALSRAEVTRDGFGTDVSGVAVRLSRKGAAALNAAFQTRAFERGLAIGTATVRTTPAQLAFDGGATALALDPGTAQALTGLGIAVAPAAPASARPDGSLAFPITRGRVDADTLAGTIRHSGGLTFSRGATAVTVSDFVIDTAPDPKLTAEAAGDRLDLLALDLGGLTRELSGRTVSLGGIGATLAPPAAAALNAAFGTTAFRAGLPIGTATVTAEGV
jgi:hypothetical protein